MAQYEKSRLTMRGTWEVARLEIATRRRTLLLRVGMLAGALTLAVVLAGWSSSVYSFWTGASVMSVIIALVTSALSASLWFHERSDRHDVINMLMLPVSNPDKFAGRLLVYVVFYWVAFVLSLIAATLVGGILDWLLFYSNTSLSVVFSDVNDISFSTLASLACALLLVQSFFVAGAAWFRTNVFLKTFVGLYVLLTVVGFMMSGIIMSANTFQLMSIVNLGFDTMTNELPEWFWSALSIAVTAVTVSWNVAFAYIKFKATDLR